VPPVKQPLVFGTELKDGRAQTLPSPCGCGMIGRKQGAVQPGFNMRKPLSAYRIAFVSILFICPAFADCISISPTSKSPYAEFDIKNTCRGAAIIPWTMTTNSGHTESDRFFATGCKTTHEQYFPGEYKFGNSQFPDGGDAEICQGPNSSGETTPPAKADNADNKKPDKQGGTGADNTTTNPDSRGSVDYDAARRAEEHTKFELASKMDTIAGWKLFLEAFPNGENAKWAKQRLQDIETQKGTASATGNNASKPFTGHLHAEFQIADNSVWRWYFDSKLTKTEPKSTIRQETVELEIGSTQAHFNAGGLQDYNCGENTPIPNSKSGQANGMTSNWVSRCSFSRTSHSVIVTIDTSGSNTGGGTHAGREIETFRLDGEQCISAELSGAGSGHNAGRPVHIEPDIRYRSTSATCFIR
jgi:hypothetical protein